MRHIMTRLSDRLLDRIVPGQEAQASECPTTARVRCSGGFAPRTGTCMKTCTTYCDGTVVCDECVC